MISAVLPLLGGALCMALRSPGRILSLAWATSLACSLAAAPAIGLCLKGGRLLILGGALSLDALSAFHLMVLYAVFILSSLYARGYFQDEIEDGRLPLKLARQYGSLWLGALAAMTLTLVSNNLGLMWVGMEAATLATAFLICVRRSPKALEAMWKYLLICSVGIAFAFIGTLLVAASAKSAIADPSQILHWTSLAGAAPRLDEKLLKAGFLFLLVGYGTKAGLAPMHSWLPDAHSQAPAPVSALFSAFMLSAGLYCIMRFGALLHSSARLADWSGGLFRLLGLASILVAAAFMLFQNDGKRLLAYSSVEHVGIISLGLGLGPAGAFAALFHTVNHSLGKSAGFFCMGRLGQAYGTHDLRRFGGAARSDPLGGNGLLACLLALLGAAPFSLFLSEFLIVKAAVEAGRAAAAAVFLACAGIVFIGVLRRAIAAAWGESAPMLRSPRPPDPASIALVALPLSALLALGLWMPEFLRSGLERSAAILLAGPGP
jgi:hydrogenase-4 component F